MKRNMFTLVELLVVIAIIALLAGISMPVISIAKQKARQTQARVDINSIQIALTEYEKDYSTLHALPNFSSSTYFPALGSDDKKIFFNFEKDESVSSKSNAMKAYDGLMETLTYTKVDGSSIGSSTTLTDFSLTFAQYNSRKKQYLRPVTTKIQDKVRQNMPLGFYKLDPWGRRYNLAFDGNYNGYIDDANGFGGITTSTRINSKVIIFSYGSDSEDKVKNYVCSWKTGR